MRAKAIELVEQRNVKPEARGQIPAFRVGVETRRAAMMCNPASCADWSSRWTR